MRQSLAADLASTLHPQRRKDVTPQTQILLIGKMKAVLFLVFVTVSGI